MHTRLTWFMVMFVLIAACIDAQTMTGDARHVDPVRAPVGERPWGGHCARWPPPLRDRERSKLYTTPDVTYVAMFERTGFDAPSRRPVEHAVRVRTQVSF